LKFDRKQPVLVSVPPLRAKRVQDARRFDGKQFKFAYFSSKMRALAAVLLFALVAHSFAQNPRLTDTLGSFAGRGFDIVYERMKPRLVAHTYNGATMRFKGQDYDSTSPAQTLRSMFFPAFLFIFNISEVDRTF
jgi:hypothetical protein